LRIFIEVKTESKKEALKKLDGSHYIIYLKEKKEKGKANIALLKLLRQYFKQNVILVSGKTSKYKIVEIITE
jgi:uncharacterized protein (TIGR00251 family)